MSETAHCLPGLMPHALQQIVPVVEQVQMARDTYRLRLYCPEIAAKILPGQFFMIRAVGRNDPLLARPFALYDVYEENGKPAGLDFGYVIVGKLTSLMATWKAGEPVEIWGPLGNGFPAPDCQHLMCVAGGIGQTPFLAVTREALGLKTYGTPARMLSQKPQAVSLCYGVRSKNYLAGVADFPTDGLNLQIATDDGSHAHHGFVTDLLAQALSSDNPPDCVFTCGPEPMMRIVAELCLREGVACWLSLETPMACGVGACFSCVTRVKEGEDWDYRRTCVEGPIFRADQLFLD
ncbi:MAG: dihydroorotate dehydrogenase electron transfer subunit [Planctomycetaceae bacterium]|nr:dihydroorotate dehydrogenase electron transfer subunit [Planctomycetaceae bacterium]